jgi:hypothetical protein
MESLTYGTLPNKEEFVAYVSPQLETEQRHGYPMELVGADVGYITKAINRGIDSHLEAVAWEHFKGKYPHKLCVRVLGAASLHTLIRRLIEIGEAEGLHVDEGALDLASSIMYTLDYEWI